MERIGPIAVSILKRAREAQRIAEAGGKIVHCPTCRDSVIVGDNGVCLWCGTRLQ